MAILVGILLRVSTMLLTTPWIVFLALVQLVYMVIPRLIKVIWANFLLLAVCGLALYVVSLFGISPMLVADYVIEHVSGTLVAPYHMAAQWRSASLTGCAKLVAALLGCGLLQALYMGGFALVLTRSTRKASVWAVLGLVSVACTFTLGLSA